MCNSHTAEQYKREFEFVSVMLAEVKAVAAQLDGVQWAKVAALAGGRRSGPECRCHWAAALAANRAPWTPQEHARMMRIAEAHNFANVRMVVALDLIGTFARAVHHGTTHPPNS
jgi:hypothetical protein